MIIAMPSIERVLVSMAAALALKRMTGALFVALGARLALAANR